MRRMVFLGQYVQPCLLRNSATKVVFSVQLDSKTTIFFNNIVTFDPKKSSASDNRLSILSIAKSTKRYWGSNIKIDLSHVSRQYTTFVKWFDHFGIGPTFVKILHPIRWYNFIRWCGRNFRTIIALIHDLNQSWYCYLSTFCACCWKQNVSYFCEGLKLD
jgi:hypothetical protein